MKFKTLGEAVNWFRDYREFDLADQVPEFWTEYDWHGWKFGDYILFQHIRDGKTISRPILGLFTDFTVWDQALVLNFVEPKRAWTWSHQFLANEQYDLYQYVCMIDSYVDTIQFWTDNIQVLGHWTSRPTRAQLKEALKQQIYGKAKSLGQTQGAGN